MTMTSTSSGKTVSVCFVSPKAYPLFNPDCKGVFGGAEVDLYLELIKTALNAQRPTTDCGPLHLTSEDFEGRAGATVTYTQRWTHRRRAG